MPATTSAMPPTMIATVAAAVASPRWAGASECWFRARAPAAEAARIVRRVVTATDCTVPGPAGRSDSPAGRVGPALYSRRMPYELPPDPATERRSRIVGRITFAISAVLVAFVAYFGYIGYEGSRQFTDAPNRSADCRRPAAFGWTYEAINYDIATDAALASEPDPMACTSSGAPAGDAVTGPGRVGLAGWYIPAGSGIGPEGPTVVLAHGWGANKSTMLDRAAILHGTYNLLLLDFRNHGQSADAATTQGVREAGDLRAMIDWLVAEKGTEQIGVLGASMGGASALAAAVRDDRVDAIIVESTHATIANAIQARLDRAGYPLSLPGSWAVLLGTLVRTGEDTSRVDPVQAITRLDDRPVLLVYGALDDSIGPNDATDLLDAAFESGTPAELVTCETAGHDRAFEACPEAYAGWVLGFLERALGPSG